MCQCTAALLAALPAADVVRLRGAAKDMQRIENKYTATISRILQNATQATLDALLEGRPVPDLAALDRVMVDHAYETMASALTEAQSAIPFAAQPAGRPLPKSGIRLSAGEPSKIWRPGDSLPAKPASNQGPKIGIPVDMPTLRATWDRVRKNPREAPRPSAFAKRIKYAYLKKIQAVWRTLSRDFRDGKKADQEAVKAAIEDAARVATSRAKTIVATETTRYQNEVRKAYYDKVDLVTHYLFVAIRDSHTTKWCADKDRGGRNGLVYKKGDEVTARETPPVHYGCRSEMTPLLRINPAHQRLINDPSRQRANRKPEPLLPHWNTSKVVYEGK